MPEEYTAKANALIEELVGPEHSASNPQNFDRVMRTNSEFAEQVKDAAADPNAFHGARAPSLAIQQETPEHRKMITMKAMGLTNGEIAEMFGRSQAHVSQVMRQPWAKLQLVKLITEAGKDPLKVMIESAAIDSAATLIEIRDDKSAPASVRVAAADKLLDRFLGKPTQHIESKSEVTNVPADIKRVEDELAALAIEEKRLGINVIKN